MPLRLGRTVQFWTGVRQRAVHLHIEVLSQRLLRRIDLPAQEQRKRQRVRGGESCL